MKTRVIVKESKLSTMEQKRRNQLNRLTDIFSSADPTGVVSVEGSPGALFK